MDIGIINDDDMCANCGTVILYHLAHVKRAKAYYDDAKDLYCSKKCFNEYIKESLKELKPIEY